MNYVIKALGFVSRVIWIVVILIPVTLGLSMEKLLQPDTVGFGEATTSFSDNQICISMPFYINNTGYYDISDINLTTVLKDSGGYIVARGETLVPVIPAGRRVNLRHDVYVGLDEIIGRMEYLLFNDTMLDLNASFSLRLAYVLGARLHTSLMVPWGAPLNNLTVSRAAYNPDNGTLILYVSFENHSPFTVEGNAYLTVYNNRSEVIGSQTLAVETAPENLFLGMVEIPIDFSKITQNGHVEIRVETGQFTAGPVKLEWSRVE